MPENGHSPFGLEPGNRFQVRGACGPASQAGTREALGNRPAPRRGSAFDGWTRCGRKRAKAREEKAEPKARRQKSSVAYPEVTVPGTEIAASGAPGGERADRKARRRPSGGRLKVRHPALHPLIF